MVVISITRQADKLKEYFLAVAYQFGGLSDNAALGRNQACAALIEDDTESSWHVPNLFPRSLEV